MTLFFDRLASPLGTLLIISDGSALRALDFHDYESRMRRLLQRHYGSVELQAGHGTGAIGDALSAYFEGDIRALDTLKVETGGTAFQRQVWAALRGIPPGTTTTYGRLAAALGHPTASRAVGLANGANPIAIVVPCHRVVGADGRLTGFGGGLPRKQWLLTHEAHAAGNARLL
ncbi:methylated-DNA--[protein]-cysteine S-methyltransferase [Lichenihabitans psoromatis]|uniref:methylated-DNA--[protein]-cysteine S-methyltransferase n=1 Tax=Lichenihabitans psoromatis TaxID=2528642 RepID=UPI001FE02AC5|nr:methylated-DNA--[protein]-cysteine S-methyltransferase [Lichenihabitans psoromatis]